MGRSLDRILVRIGSPSSITGVVLVAAASWVGYAILAGAPAEQTSKTASTTGIITGRVRVTGPPHGNPLIRMGVDPACSKLRGGQRVFQETELRSSDGGLQNVFVSLKGSFPKTPVPTAPVTIDQRGCIYVPRVVGARVGQTLQITNSDPTLHNMHSASATGQGFNVSQPPATRPFQLPLKAEEVMLPLKCDIHSWMVGYVGVVNHPYFAVSGEGGSFTIRDVPVGRHAVQAWHELYGSISQTVTVQPRGASTLELTYAIAQAR